MDATNKTLSFSCRHVGFTLVELLVTVSVVAILSSIAAPSFNSMVKRNRVTVQQNDLLSDIMLARLEAIKRSRSVSICSSNTAGTACSGNNDDWHQGWLVYVNSDKTGIYDSSEDELLRIHDPLSAGSTLGYTYTTLTFSSRGFMSSNEINARFAFCNRDNNTDYEREIKMLSTGRASRRGATAITCT